MNGASIPADVKRFALFYCYPGELDIDWFGWIFTILTLIHLFVILTFFMRRMKKNIIYKIFLVITMIDIPVIVLLAYINRILVTKHMFYEQYALSIMSNVKESPFVSWAFVILAIIHLSWTFFVKKIQPGVICNIISLVILLDVPVITFGIPCICLAMQC